MAIEHSMGFIALVGYVMNSFGPRLLSLLRENSYFTVFRVSDNLFFLQKINKYLNFLNAFF
jgi:hypothetical protein